MSVGSETVIVCGGVGRDFSLRLHEACGDSCRLVATDAESGQALEAMLAVHRGTLVFFPESWLRDHSLDLLARLGRAASPLQVVLVGTETSPAVIARAIPLGLRGMLDPGASAQRIGQAIAAICSGELWLSRRTVLEVMNILASADRVDTSGTWTNLPSLTEREHSVLTHVMEGSSNKDIAAALGISEQTVKIHLQHIYRKLGVHRRTDLLLSKI